ncbi:MAG: hypothetical protein ABFD25_20495 [Clostridiaceae bacterium]
MKHSINGKRATETGAGIAGEIKADRTATKIQITTPSEKRLAMTDRGKQ